MPQVRTLGLAWLTGAALFGCSGAGPSVSTPTEVVQRLYSSMQGLRVTGAPAPAELAAIAPYLSEELTTLLRRAREMHDTDVARAPDEKPAFTEGDLFSSLFEGSTSLEVLGDSTEGTGHRLAVRFTYDAVPPAVHWTDQVVVIQENGRFVVSDVRYGGNWDFGNKGSLVALLREALSRPPEGKDD